MWDCQQQLKAVGLFHHQQQLAGECQCPYHIGGKPQQSSFMLYLHQGLTVLPQDLVLEAPITEALQRNELQHLQLWLSSSNEAHDVLKHCLAVTFLENGCRAQKDNQRTLQDGAEQGVLQPNVWCLCDTLLHFPPR